MKVGIEQGSGTRFALQGWVRYQSGKGRQACLPTRRASEDGITLIPAGFVSFVPLQLLHQFTWPLLGAMVGFTVLIVSIAVGMFKLGLRRYESGNLLGMQN